MRSIMQCCLLFQFALACIKMGKPELAQKAVFIGRDQLPDTMTRTVEGL
jgi:hypothetical protein